MAMRVRGFLAHEVLADGDVGRVLERGEVRAQISVGGSDDRLEAREFEVGPVALLSIHLWAWIF
jgi:hypothetical protein